MLGSLSHGMGTALFGAARQAVLRILFGQPDQRFYQRQIIRDAALGSGAVQRELKTLSDAGILTRTIEGRQTYFQVNPECPIFEELRGIVRKTFGVAQVLGAALQQLEPNIEVAFIFGSVADGSETAASDIDVMVVSESVSLDDLVTALAGAQTELRREVNPSLYGTKEFCRKLASGHHFLSHVVAGPKIFLIGDEHELARLAQVPIDQGTQNKPAGNRRPVRGR